MKIAEDLVSMLISDKATIATAESCTGGLVGAALTDVSGASRCYVGGAVAYAYDVKRRILGVPDRLLVECGAVSKQCARAMAVGARARFLVDWAIATTGIAGPGGGTPDKPVGLVYIAVAGPSHTVVERHHFEGDRAQVRAAAVETALALAADCVAKEPR